MKPEEERDLIAQYYRQAVAPARSDEEELAIAQELLEKAKRGFCVDDTGEDLIYASDPNLPVDAEFLVDESALRQQRLRKAVPLAGALLAGLLALFLAYGGGSPPKPVPTPTATVRTWMSIPTQTLTATATSTNTPTPTATMTQSPTPTATPLPPEEVEVKPEPVKLDAGRGAVVPVSLEIAGRYLPIVPTGLRDGNWAYVTEADQMSWLAGSYVNVVLGLPFTADSSSLLASTLGISDTITLRNNVAGTNHYQVVERRYVDVYANEVLNQRRAGLTLVLLGGNEENPDRRLVVWAVPVEYRKEVTDTP